MFFQTLDPWSSALLNNEDTTYLQIVLNIIYHGVFYLFQQSGLTLVELASNQIRLKKWNRVTALLCVNTFETKVKETFALGNQKVN